MSEFYAPPQSDIDAYQAFVRESRFGGASEEGWDSLTTRIKYADYVQDEVAEVLFQHGPSMNLMIPTAWIHMVRENPSLGGIDNLRELQDKIADEMGDTVWFLTDILQREGQDMTEILERKLSEKTGEQTYLRDFAALDQQVVEHADTIGVPHKWQQYGDGIQTVAEFPGLVYMRYSEELIQALKSVNEDPSDRTSNAAVDMLLALTYIAHDRLDTTIETIANFNQAKLQNRLANDGDKSKDISFADFRTAVA